MQEPTDTPVATPDVALIVAILVLLLDHMPPLVASVSVAVPPTVVEVAPPIVAGIAVTVTER